MDKKQLTLFITTILFLLNFLVNAQSNTYNSKNNKTLNLNPWDGINAIRVASNFVREYEAEVSYLITSYPKQEPGFGALAMRVQYVGLGAEYLRLGNSNVFGIKASYEESFALFAGQVGVDYLTTFSDSQVRIAPKIGASLFGYITLYYGWNFDLNKSSSIHTRDQFLSLQINILQ